MRDGIIEGGHWHVAKRAHQVKHQRVDMCRLQRSGDWADERRIQLPGNFSIVRRALLDKLAHLRR